MNTNEVIVFTHPEALTGIDYKFQVVDSKLELVKWNTAKLGPKPSIEFLESKRAEAEAYYAAQAKAQETKAAETQLQSENYALVKMVVELREKLAVATGVKFDPVPTELAAKLAAVEALKTAEAVQP
jgi:hypothetical protein